jgi:hypothetical protein
LGLLAVLGIFRTHTQLLSAATTNGTQQAANPNFGTIIRTHEQSTYKSMKNQQNGHIKTGDAMV